MALATQSFEPASKVPYQGVKYTPVSSATKQKNNEALVKQVQSANQASTNLQKNIASQVGKTNPPTYDPPKVDPTPVATAPVATAPSEPSYDYMSAMMDLLKAQYDAQERARQAKLEALYKSNNESADRQIGLYNNQANRNNKQIANLTKGGTNGAMLSSQLQNNLWRDNGINKAINTRDLANANEESASYATQASNIGTLMNSANNIMSSLGSLDAESQRKLISRLEDIYR